MSKKILVASMLLVVASASQAQSIYNSILPQGPTGGPTFTGGLPRNFVADDFSTVAPPTGQFYRVNAIGFQPILVADRSYTNVTARVRVYSSYAPSATMVFTGLVSDVTWNFGNLNSTITGAEFFNASLDYAANNVRFNLATGQNMGVSILLLENGVATNDLTVGITNIAGPTTPPASMIGTSTNGWFRDANNDGLISDSDGRIFTGSWSSMALDVQAEAVPEPGTLAALSLGALALLRRRKKA